MIKPLEAQPSFANYIDCTVGMMMMSEEQNNTITQPLHACQQAMDVVSSHDAKHDFASVVSNDIEGDDDSMLLQLPESEHFLSEESEDETSMDVSESSYWSDSVQTSRAQVEQAHAWAISSQTQSFQADLTNACYQQILKRFQERMQQTDHSRYMIRQSLQDSRGQFPASEAFFLHQRCLELEASRYTSRKWVEQQLRRLQKLS